jgi:hypothetical protein
MTASSERCVTCGGSARGADAFMNLAGETVCRRCYYAEQTKLQRERVEESEKKLGVYGAFNLFKRLFAGGVLVLVGSAGLLGGLESGAWKVSAVTAAILALGVAVIAIALKGARNG